MKTQRNSQQPMPMYLLAVATLLALFTASADAQAQTPKFKVGDRVEFSRNSACLGDRFALQATGTIVQVNTTRSTMNYVIQIDPEPGRSPETTIVPIYHLYARGRGLQQ